MRFNILHNTQEYFLELNLLAFTLNIEFGMEITCGQVAKVMLNVIMVETRKYLICVASTDLMVVRS